MASWCFFHAASHLFCHRSLSPYSVFHLPSLFPCKALISASAPLTSSELFSFAALIPAVKDPVFVPLS